MKQNIRRDIHILYANSGVVENSNTGRNSKIFVSIRLTTKPADISPYVYTIVITNVYE